MDALRKPTNPRINGNHKGAVGAMGTKLNATTPAKPAKANSRVTRTIPPRTALWGDSLGKN